MAARNHPQAARAPSHPNQQPSSLGRESKVWTLRSAALLAGLANVPLYIALLNHKKRGDCFLLFSQAASEAVATGWAKKIVGMPRSHPAMTPPHSLYCGIGGHVGSERDKKSSICRFYDHQRLRYCPQQHGRKAPVIARNVTRTFAARSSFRFARFARLF